MNGGTNNLFCWHCVGEEWCFSSKTKVNIWKCKIQRIDLSSNYSWYVTLIRKNVTGLNFVIEFQSQNDDFKINSMVYFQCYVHHEVAKYISKYKIENFQNKLLKNLAKYTTTSLNSPVDDM